MTRHFVFALAIAVPLAFVAGDRPARAADNACWLSAMSENQKRHLVLNYAQIKQTSGKAAADAWAQEQKAYYVRKSVRAGTCPPQDAVQKAEQAPQDQPVAEGNESCNHWELENQNIPNPGGSMAYALLFVCKD